MIDPPISIRGFRVVRLLGRGGMGAVYEAFQESMRRRVALKILEPNGSGSLDEVIRFEREAWIGGRLSHPNIVRVFDRGEDEGRHYLVMEFIEGGSLADWIHGIGSQPLEHEARKARMVQIASLFSGVASALSHIHQAGIVHRDIKPANLLLDSERHRLLLTDFGVARDQGATRLTTTGSLIGTIAYMAPEQLLAERAKIDQRSDVWSLGASLYEALTLRLPFTATTRETYFRAVTRRLPTRPLMHDRTVPRDLEAILLKCLEHEPDRRYSSAERLEADLRHFSNGGPVQARVPSAAGRALRWARLNKGLVGLGATFLALIGAMGIVAALAAGGARRRELTAYHRSIARDVVQAVAQELKEDTAEAMREVRRAAGAGSDSVALRAAMARAPGALGEPDLVPLTNLYRYSVIIVGKGMLVYKLDAKHLPRGAFVGTLMSDSNLVAIGAGGWWFDPKDYLGRHIDELVGQGGPMSALADLERTVRGTSVAVLSPDGSVLRQLRAPSENRTAAVAPLIGPFEGYRVRVASAAKN